MSTELQNDQAAGACLALNATNHLVHALVVGGIFTPHQAEQLLMSIAKSTRADDLGEAGEALASWLDEAAKQYRA